MSKIEIVTQPEPQAPKNSSSGLEDQTLEKLKGLVEEKAPEPDEEEEERPTSPNKKHSEQVSEHKDMAVDTSEKTKGEKIIDHDGFEVPEGKIPLDGHFSTNEIKELVDVAKQEGLLKKDIQVKVLEKNDVVGDKVVITDDKDKEKEKEEENEKEKEKEGE